MAKLAEYGELDYDQLLDYTIDDDTINMISAFLESPTVEERINEDNITISIFKKSFWSKKLEGYIKLSYINDAKVDVTKSSIVDAIISIDKFNEEYYDEDYVVPKFSDILIGFDYYRNGISRKGLFSYGLLNHNINVKDNAASQVHFEEMQNGFGSVRERYMSNRCDKIRKLQSIFKIFEKYETIQ